MTAFLENRIDPSIAVNFDRAIVPARSILEASSGFKQTVEHHTDPVHDYTFRYNARTEAQLEPLTAFLENIGGKAFRFKDWIDYTGTDEALGTVGGSPFQTVWQIVKTYTVTDLGSPVLTYVRNIIKPVAGTVTLKIDGSPSGDFMVNHKTGLLTLTGALVGGEVLTVSFEFDLPVLAVSFGGQQMRRASGTELVHATNIRLEEFKIKSSL